MSAPKGWDGIQGFDPTAGQDLTQDENLFMQLIAATGAVQRATAATQALVGVLHDGGVQAGDKAGVAVSGGRAELKLGGTVSADDLLTSDASGQGVTAASTERYGARAMEPGVSGQIIWVLIERGVAP